MTKTAKQQLDSHCFEHLKLGFWICFVLRASDFEFKNVACGVKLLRLTCLSPACKVFPLDRSS